MARNGSGTYSLPEAAFVNGTTIDAVAVNSDFSDIASALTLSLAADGQTVPTGNLAMGGFKHTGVADGSSRTDYASLGQVAKGTLLYAADTGAADAYAIAPAPGITANVVGFLARWKVTNANLTTTPTLAANSLTAGTIVWPDGSALAAGDLPAGALVETIIVSLSGSTPTWHLQTVANFTGTGKVVKGTSPTLTTAVLGSSTATTQAQKDNSTKVATTAYVDRVGVQQIVSTQATAVATGTTVLPIDDTIPQNTEGDQYMTLAITPKSATSTLRISVLGNFNLSTADILGMALFQDSTANALRGVAVVGGNISGSPFETQIALTHVMTSGTTSATTFKVRAGTNGASTVTFNGNGGTRLFGGVNGSHIIIEEIGA